jgi:hypothetical protein
MTDRAILEYQYRDTKRAPEMGAYSAVITRVRFASGISLQGSQSLTETRHALDNAGFSLENQVPVGQGTSRHWQRWHEIWKKNGIIEEEEDMGTTPQDIERKKLVRMAKGPYVSKGTICVPGDWASPEASRFWLNYGFGLDIKTVTWTRSSKKPINGKVYSAAAWLESTQRQFFTFWKAEIKKKSLARIQARAEAHYGGNWR